MKRVLITGINGFVGSHLAELVLAFKNVELFGLIRSKKSDLQNLKEIREKIKLIECDITDYFKLCSSIEKTQPDYIFHLAAQPFIPDSWKNPQETYKVNLNGTLNLFEAVRKAKIDSKIHVASTSEVYGVVKQNELPVTEKNPLRPFSPYGASKASMELFALHYYHDVGLKIFITRAFNHTGPRAPQNYILSDWARQIALIERGEKNFLSVGNLDAGRDFCDVRDVVRAYWLVLKKGNPGTAYNVCSGKSIKISQILLKLKSFSKKKVKTKNDPKKFRSTDIKEIFGSNKKIRMQTEWGPKIPFDRTIEDTLSYWRKMA